MSQDKINLALIQMSSSSNQKENLEKCSDRIEEAARAGAKIVSTQDLFRTQYFCQNIVHDNFSLAEPISGPSVAIFSKLAAAYRVAVVACLFERRAPGLYHDTAVVIDSDGTLLGLYRKMHILEQPYSHEGFYFTPGDLGFKSFDTKVECDLAKNDIQRTHWPFLRDRRIDAYDDLSKRAI